MTAVRIKLVLVVLLILMAARQVGQVEAAKGEPGTPTFGFGAVLYPDGPMVGQALVMLPDLHPDWLYVPVTWSKIWPIMEAQPDLSAIDRVMAVADQKDIAVVMSVSNAPAWAQSPEGPTPQASAQLVTLLAQRYPRALQAVELFPKANTLAGWGSAPNPRAYLAMFEAVQANLLANGKNILLVAAGLQEQELIPSVQSTETAMDDLIFLQELYNAGAKDVITVISLQYADIHRDLLASPLETDRMIFRHYEKIRALMVANEHSHSLIWITSFQTPSGLIDHTVVASDDVRLQNQWLEQGYAQVVPQLYVGAAFLQSLNPPAVNGDSHSIVMLQTDEQVHPFYATLKFLVSENNQRNHNGLQKPGRAKEEGQLVKQR